MFDVGFGTVAVLINFAVTVTGTLPGASVSGSFREEMHVKLWYFQDFPDG